MRIVHVVRGLGWNERFGGSDELEGELCDLT